jgi:hypothetical protein
MQTKEARSCRQSLFLASRFMCVCEGCGRTYTATRKRERQLLEALLQYSDFENRTRGGGEVIEGKDK